MFFTGEELPLQWTQSTSCSKQYLLICNIIGVCRASSASGIILFTDSVQVGNPMLGLFLSLYKPLISMHNRSKSYFIVA